MGRYSTISPNTRESTCYAKFWENIKGKCVESYGDLTLHDLSMHCKNLCEGESMLRYTNFRPKV